MTPHPRHEEASQAALDQALPPFIERFVREDKRTRASSLIGRQPREWRELISLIDTHRGRPLTDDSLTPWNTVRGVFLVGKEAYSCSCEEAMKLHSTEQTLFIAYGATFAVAHDHQHGKPLLLT